jgi:ubiquinone/menaquinone biosynthesis C-methylase UbiE
LDGLVRLIGLVGLVGLTLLAQAPSTHPITGRRIATVMSHLGAEWLDRPERVAEEEPDKAIAALAIRTGATIADVGAGSGYMTIKLAAAVGPNGRVFATDVQPEMIEKLRARVNASKLGNVTPVLSTTNDPQLPDSAIDLILMVDVYHELAEPQQMLRKMRRALKPSGRLVLLEYRKEDPSIPIREEHKMTVADAKAEVEAEGYHLASVIETLPRQHILIFTVAP